jgi:uncharacterized protein
MEQLFELYFDRLRRTGLDFVRYLHDEINWDSQLIVIVGARGVGKTTMILQHIKLTDARDKSLYVSADHTYFSTHSLFDTASEFYRNGGEIIYIDEVHKYSGWSREVKMMYDYLPDLKVVVTGSSILEIRQGTDADLSRRAIPYTLEGLSFREYLNFRLHLNIRPYSLEEILSGKAELPVEIKHPLVYFKDYLANGYFPFFHQDDYRIRLENVVNQTMEVDIPSFAKMNISTAVKLKKLLYVISVSVPFKPNYTELGRAISADRSTVADYMTYLEKARLVRLLRIPSEGMAQIEKVEKVYLGNTNFIYALADGKPEIGNVRETFFHSALCLRNKVTASPVSDFKIDSHTFEVGGKSKTRKQIKDVEDSFVVKDDIEFAFRNTIPLWAFGLNY